MHAQDCEVRKGTAWKLFSQGNEQAQEALGKEKITDG